MGVVFTQDSAYAKEMRRHNAHHSEYGAPGRPYTFREFPKRLYKAERMEGRITITDAQTANDAQEERNLHSRGFVFGQDAALRACEQETHLVHGTLAAEREFQIQHGRLSPQAVTEVRAAEAAHGASHMPDMPIAPLAKRRGRPTKATVTDARA